MNGLFEQRSRKKYALEEKRCLQSYCIYVLYFVNNNNLNIYYKPKYFDVGGKYARWNCSPSVGNI